MPTLLISSTNYNGQYGDITFFPDTGGTFNLGYQLIPYYYVADYIYGNYDVFFSAFNKTCSFEFILPTPTPTVTITPTNTITPTPTNTVTPSITLTRTLTPTPTISITPSITRTITPTISITPSITPTISLTPSITPTITPTPIPCKCLSFTNTGGTNSEASYLNCSGVTSLVEIKSGNNVQVCGSNPSVPSGVTYTVGDDCINGNCCRCFTVFRTSACINTVTYTGCNGTVVTNLLTPIGTTNICAFAMTGGNVLCSELDFKITQSGFCTNGVCSFITPTPTPTLTRTPTLTPTPTPTSGATSLCNCIILANTGTTIDDTYSYIDCDNNLISDINISPGVIDSFCAQSFTANTEGQTQIVTGSTCSVDGDCSNCVCITFTNNTGGPGTYGYRDCAGDTRGPRTIRDGESIQVCGFRVDTSMVSKNILWSIGGVCEDGVTCPIVLTSESILLWDDSNQLVYLYDHPNNTITDIGLVDIMGGSLDIARNQTHIWMYEPIDSENTIFRQWNITSTNPFSAPTYADYSITAGTDNGLTVFNSIKTVFAMSSNTTNLLKIDIGTGNVTNVDSFSDISVSDFIWNPSDSVIIIAGQSTITGNYGIIQYDGTLIGYHSNGSTPIVALYQYGSQLFYIEDNFDVYQIDLTSPYTTTYIQTIPGLSNLAGAAQDDPNIITVMFT